MSTATDRLPRGTHASIAKPLELCATVAFLFGWRLIQSSAAPDRQAASAARGPSKTPVAPHCPVQGLQTQRRNLTRADRMHAFREQEGTSNATTATSSPPDPALFEGEAKLRDLMATLDLAAVMARSLDGTILFWSAGCERLYGWTSAEAVGRTAHDLLHTVYPSSREEVEAALAHYGEWSGELRHRTRDGQELVIAARKVLRKAEHGRPLQIMESVADVTDLRHTEEALRASEARFARASEAARMGAWEWDPVLDSITCSPNREKGLMGRPSDSVRSLATLLDAVHPEDRGVVSEALRRVLAREADILDAEFRSLWPDGTVRWLRARGRAVGGADGTVLHMSGISIDVTEQVEARRRRDLLAHEVDHRVKNALAVVQSVLRLIPHAEPHAFVAAVEARVAALARAHALLAAEGWAGAELRVVAERELAALKPHAERGATPVTLLGPTIALRADAVQPLTMVLHELATNAANYGALSQPEGRVEVRWGVDRIEGDERLMIRWSEAGGPALVEAPGRRGFGSRLIEATVRGQLGGTLTRGWAASGLICEIVIPLRRATARADEVRSQESEAPLPTVKRLCAVASLSGGVGATEPEERSEALGEAERIAPGGRSWR